MPVKLVDPKALKPGEKRSLRAQCDGEWERVTVDADGSFVVHNNAWKAQQYLEKNHKRSLGDLQGSALTTDIGRTTGPYTPPDPPPAGGFRPHPKQPSTSAPVGPTSKAQEVTSARTPDRVEVAQTPPAVNALRSEGQTPAGARQPPLGEPPRASTLQQEAQTRAVAHLITEGVEECRNNQRRGGVNVIKTRGPEDERPREILTSLPRSRHGEIDWHAEDLELSASQLLEMCRNGIPDNLQFSVAVEVLMVYGLEMEAVEATLRHPRRVEIRPESFEKTKHYPILGFYRGDVAIILGMRIPSAPQVIAAYVGSLLTPDGYTRPTPTTGGGGARRQQGLPKSWKASVRALRAEGAYINDEILTAQLADRVDVLYANQNLGKISIGEKVPRQQVESDYQRCLRKIAAIKMREEKSA